MYGLDDENRLWLSLPRSVIGDIFGLDFLDLAASRVRGESGGETSG